MIRFTRGCPEFVASIQPFVANLRGVGEAQENGMVTHTIDVQADAFQCGFQIEIDLDRLVVTPRGGTFDVGVWWISGSVPLGITSVVLRDHHGPALMVATAGSVDQVIADPYVLSTEEGSCGSLPASRTVISRDGQPLPCTPTEQDGTIEACEGTIALFSVPYFVPRSPGAAVVSRNTETRLVNGELLTPPR